MINVISPSRYQINKTSIINDTEKLLLSKYQLKEEYQLNIVFVGIRKIKSVEKHFKKTPQAHPILTLSYINDKYSDNGENLIGEIIICYPQAVLLAAQKEKTVNQMIMQLIDHGLENIFSD